MGAILEEGEVEGGALRTSTNVSWTQHGHMLDIKGVCVLANPWISFVFPARCRAKTFGVRPQEVRMVPLMYLFSSDNNLP